MQAENRHYWFKSGSYNLLLNLQGLLFGFGGFYLLVRILDKQSFGIWTLFIATTSIFEMVWGGLIINALIKFLSQASRNEYPSIMVASFFLSGIIALCCLILNVSLAGYLAEIWHYPSLAKMLYLYSMVFFLQVFLFQFQSLEQARLSFEGVFLSSLVKQAGFFVYVLVCYIGKYQILLVNLIYAQGLSVLAGIIVEYSYIKSDLSFFAKLDWEWVKRLFNFGKYSFGSSIGGLLIITISQMMLGALLSPAASGAFNVAGKISGLTEVPANVLGTILFPQSAKRFASDGHDAIKYLYEKSVGTVLALLIPALLFLFLFPGFVVHIIAGGNYPETIPIIKITVLSCLLNPFSRLFGTIVDSIGKPEINFMIIVVFTCVELVLIYFMIKQFGIMGAAYATLIANLFLFAVMQIILRRELRVNFLNTFIFAVRFYPEFLDRYIKPFLRRQH